MISQCKSCKRDFCESCEPGKNCEECETYCCEICIQECIYCGQEVCGDCLAKHAIIHEREDADLEDDEF